MLVPAAAAALTALSLAARASAAAMKPLGPELPTCYMCPVLEEGDYTSSIATSGTKLTCHYDFQTCEYDTETGRRLPGSDRSCGAAQGASRVCPESKGKLINLLVWGDALFCYYSVPTALRDPNCQYSMDTGLWQDVTTGYDHLCSNMGAPTCASTMRRRMRKADGDDRSGAFQRQLRDAHARVVAQGRVDANRGL